MFPQKLRRKKKFPSPQIKVFCPPFAFVFSQVTLPRLKLRKFVKTCFCFKVYIFVSSSQKNWKLPQKKTKTRKTSQKEKNYIFFLNKKSSFWGKVKAQTFPSNFSIAASFNSRVPTSQSVFLEKKHFVGKQVFFLLGILTVFLEWETFCKTLR